MPSRRAFLGAAVLATMTSGCGRAADVLLGVRPTVRVAVSWSARELQAFRAVLDCLEQDCQQRGAPKLGRGVDLIPLGDEIATAFDSHSARRPDVVMLPQPGLVKAHLPELKPLPDHVVPRPWPYGEIWREMLFHSNNPEGDPQCYGLPFKIAHKSVIWYRRSVFADRLPPQSWREWLDLNRTLSDRRITPLALPAADGWMLTDFFENVLLGTAPEVYRRLARAGPQARMSTEPAVRHALELLGEMWATPLAGGVNGALVQQFSDAVVEVFGYRRAAMVLAPDFAEPLVRRLVADSGTPDDFGIFSFPTIGADPATVATVAPRRECALPPAVGRPPLVVGGDVAVLHADAVEEAGELIRQLADPATALPWIGGYGGFLSAHPGTPLTAYTCELRALARQLDDGDRSIGFDLSDQLGPLGGSSGLWLVLQNFLKEIGGLGARADLDSAVRTALDALRELEG